MDAIAPDPNTAVPQELSLEYFDSHPRNYSAQILKHLASNPLFRFLWEKRHKRPNACEAKEPRWSWAKYEEAALYFEVTSQ
jgi:hypothetical protein